MKAQRPEQLELELETPREARRSREGDSLEQGLHMEWYPRLWADSIAQNAKREGDRAAPDGVQRNARRAQAQKALGTPVSVQRRREKLRTAWGVLAAWLAAGALLAALMGSGGCASTNVHRDLYRGKISAPYTYIKGYIGENRWRAQACEGVDIESRLSLAGARMCKRVVHEAIRDYAYKLKYGRATRKGLNASQTRDARRRELEGRMDDLQGQIDLRFGPVYGGY